MRAALALFPLALGALLAVPLVRAATPDDTPHGRFGAPSPPAPEAAKVVPQALAQLPPARVRVELKSSASANATLALSQQSRELARCYQQALTRLPDLEGTLSIQLQIQPDGHTQGEVQIDRTGDWRLVSCVQEELGDWIIPPDTARRLRFDLVLRPD